LNQCKRGAPSSQAAHGWYHAKNWFVRPPRAGTAKKPVWPRNAPSTTTAEASRARACSPRRMSSLTNSGAPPSETRARSAGRNLTHM